MLPILFWLLKSLLILAILNYIVPPLVNGLTGNSWSKLPIMIVLSIPAGAFMAWVNYVPYLLLFLWLALNKYTLQAMTEKKFESESQMKINKPLFYMSSYSYIVLSCFFAWFFQVEVVSQNNLTGEGVLLWKQLLGLA